jgi:hypothetical protein
MTGHLLQRHGSAEVRHLIVGWTNKPAAPKRTATVRANGDPALASRPKAHQTLLGQCKSSLDVVRGLAWGWRPAADAIAELFE